MNKVENLFPTQPYPKRLAFVGECPGEQECNTGVPFIGKAGSFLNQAIESIGLTRDQVFFGNVCQYQPPGNKIRAFATNSSQILEGLEQLKKDLEQFKPDLVICLGNTALSAFMPWSKEVSRKKKKIELFYNPFSNNPDPEFKAGPWATICTKWDGAPTIGAYRGTFFQSKGFFEGYKCYGTYHPSTLNYSFQDKWLFYADFKKMKRLWDEPTPRFFHNGFYTDFDILVAYLQSLIGSGSPTVLGFDIEGTAQDGITCLSFAHSKREAVFVGFINIETGEHIHTPEQEAILWSLVSEICYDNRIKKVMHNASYEMFVLAIRYQIYIRNVEDTMDKQWCLFAELPKNLGFLNSLYTAVPYYKEDRTVIHLETHAEYNCKDSCVTLECYESITKDLKEFGPAAEAQYQLFMENKPGVVDMQLTGAIVDLEEVRRQWLKAKKNKSRIERAIASFWGLSDFNVNKTSAGADRQNLLYKVMGLPVRKNKKTRSASADKDALYQIGRSVRKNRKHFQTCKLMIKASELSKEMGSLNCIYEELPDGTIMFRSSFAAPHTVTGRWNSKISYLGSGRNLQNISSEEKKIILAPPGYLIAQYDLSSADAWTVAAHSDAAGDPTMLLDLMTGIKPAKLLRYMMDHGEKAFDGMTLEQIKKLSKAAPDDKLYVGCKARLYSSFYLGGILKSLDEIYKKSKGTVSLEAQDLKKIDQAIKKRYPGIARWQGNVRNLLWKRLPMLKTAAGQTRIVLGDPRSDETLRELLSSEPQANTTHWINLAVNRFLYDPCNRNEQGEIIVRPIMSVHDSIISIFKEEDLEQVKMIMPECFNNPIEIAGRRITCPAMGAIGRTWAQANGKGALCEI